MRELKGRPHSAPWTWEDRITNYLFETKLPRSLFIGGDGRMIGYWIMGNNYQVKSGFYGGYPATYLKRVRALYPDRRKVLHLFSGAVDLETFPGDTVDINLALAMTHPKGGMHYVDDAQSLERVPLKQYTLVLADPPYSVEDAEHYKTTMVKRDKVVRALQGLPSGAHVVWLDQVCPKWRKDFFDLAACVGMQRSSGHRDRTMRIFVRK